jgi:hypothetical protein
MAVSYHSSFDDRPRSGGGAVLALIIVIAVTLVAFYATDAGVFEGPPTARTHMGHIVVSRPDFTDNPQVEEAATLSVARPEPQAAAAACNYKACSKAYRSFNASDCSYQPYDGPRRQCRK